ncbi:urocanate hydratase [Actinomadura roseirufa]|uniref:urocanate hydratase n=1 Tax=Actinomadura roseirufa TaxID=2094049 RepID=UPI001040F932|nr:urocanate hydratase [Actinomadura roseirufa]
MSAGKRPPVEAARGRRLRCRGWRQEGLLRMLENTLENGERPEDLIIYAATGKAARDWDSYAAIVEALTDLRDDETLVVQSGKPVARFATSAAAPRVVVANTNLVGQYATWDTFYDLQKRGLISYGQYTAGAWQYIGQQGVVQTTYETFAAAARTHFDGSLRGRFVVSAGLGGMGGAQPLAMKLHGAVAVIVEVDEAKADRRLASGYLDVKAHSVAEAMAAAERALADRSALSVGLIANAADALPEIVAARCPDLVTDQTSAHDMRDGYVAAGMSPEEARRMRRDDPNGYELRALDTVRRHVEAMVAAQDAGAVVFEYGNAIRYQAARAGYRRANDFDGFVKKYIRPNFCVGKGPCRWVALSGDENDIRLIDEAILERFAGDPSITGWIAVAMSSIPHQGLPARSSWFGYGQRLEFGLMVNDMVRDGVLAGPVAMSRDHLDSGAVAQPTRETEGMLDGSDAVADWPILNALLNASGGADLVAVHQGAGSGMGGSISAGVTLVIDGTAECRAKLERVLRTDPGIGVIRHADAGYPEAIAVAEDSDLVVPRVGGGATGPPRR